MHFYHKKKTDFFIKFFFNISAKKTTIITIFLYLTISKYFKPSKCCRGFLKVVRVVGQPLIHLKVLMF